jgi:hypothetical protein
MCFLSSKPVSSAARPTLGLDAACRTKWHLGNGGAVLLRPSMPASLRRLPAASKARGRRHKGRHLAVLISLASIREPRSDSKPQ